MPRALDLTLGTLLRHLPLLAVLWLVVLGLFVMGQRFAILGEPLVLHPDSLANREGDVGGREVEIYTLLPRDAIRSIDAPSFVSADAARDQMAPTELVLGLEIDGDARAYPITMLSRHEIVNDVVAGVPVAVTYCPLCFTGMVFDRRVDGETLEFGVSGKLVMNDLVMYDRQTGSLWQQILGEGIRGDFLGMRLTPLPASHTTWARWLASHPDTVVLDKGRGYRSDAYEGYYQSSDLGVIGGAGGDERLPGKELVLGLILGDQPMAYPFAALEASPVVNDAVSGVSLAVFYDERSDTAVAFDRRVAGRELSFDARSLRHEGDDLVVRDRETGSVWSAFTGRALEGPLAGEQLSQLPGTYAFWFAWSDFYTRTGLFQPADLAE